MTEYRLGTAIPMMIPFHRISKPKQFTTKKVIVTIVVIGIVKIAFLCYGFCL